MKKKLLVMILTVFCFLIVFSESYQYYIYQNDVEIGNILVEFYPESYLGKTTSTFEISGNIIKYVAETKYDKTWDFKEYSLDIFVDNQKQGTLTSTYDGKKIQNKFNGIKLKSYNAKNAIILDNNFIFDHIFAILYKELSEATYTAFVPQLVLNQSTWDLAILDIRLKFKDSETLIISSLGVEQYITFKDKKIIKYEIPAQGFEVTEVKKEQKEKNYIEKEISFNSFDDGFKLEGSLMIPSNFKTGTQLPAFVLVHGSGPNDRNETMGPLAPFKDLSEQLVSNNFIVLKYDKRTYTMIKNNQDALNVMPEDFIKDAQAAIRYLKTLPEVDQDKIIVIGHSQGASFLPYIVEGQNVAAAIAISPGIIEITDLMVYQIEYQIKNLEKLNKDNIYDDLINQLKSLLPEMKEINEKMKKEEIEPDNIYLDSMTGKFLLQWSELTQNMVDKFINMKVPVLIINGTEDLKTPYELLKEKENELKSKEDLQIIYIENMGHELYKTGTAKFEEKVVEQIKLWLKNLELK